MSNLPSERAERRLPDKKPLLTIAEARAEADRCLYCADAPCIQACPTSIDIPTFIKKIASENVRGSAQTIFAQNLLGYSCARVCPVEVLCEGSCVYTGWQKKPISIGRLQRYATELAVEAASAEGALPLFTAKAKTGKRVALVGGGPASLACAGTLALEGHTAVVFEQRALAGGLNTTGIAPYKMHADEAVAEAEWIKTLGDVEIRTGSSVGGQISAASLLAEFDAVFLGLGLGEDTRLNIPGEDGPGVVGATAWIERMKLSPGAAASEQLGRVVVIGGGNTAVDVARECALLGAREVVMAYRRGPEAMSAYKHEMDAARKEGVRVVHHVQPLAVVRNDDGKVVALQMSTGDGGTMILDCDLVVLAIGQLRLRSLAKELTGVELDAKGCVVVDAATGRTGNAKVYAGGDCINGGKEVVNAVADGRNAARAMHAVFTGATGAAL